MDRKIVSAIPTRPTTNGAVFREVGHAIWHAENLIFGITLECLVTDYRTLKRIPGPSTPIKKARTKVAAAIHPWLRVIGPAAGTKGSGEVDQRKWSIWVRPKAAAAAGSADVKTTVHPLGLNAAARPAVVRAARYGASVTRRNRDKVAGCRQPAKGRTIQATSSSDR